MSGEGTYVCRLDEGTQAKALKELHENPTQRASQIETLRTWVKAQPHINSRTDDEFLLRFLRNAKFSQLRAQELIDNFWTMRSSPSKGAPDWFSNYDASDKVMSELLDLGINVPSLKRDSQNRRIIISRAAAYDPKVHSILDVMRASFLAVDVELLDELNQVHGYVVINDFEGMTASHVFGWTRDMISKSMRCYQDTYPLRTKALHFVNMPSIVNGVMEICKYFMKDKFKKRMFFHSSWESLHRQVDKDVLPTEYKGNGGPLEDMIKAFKEKALKSKAEFESNDRHGVDESKRPLPTNQNDGFLGSFRKLSVE